MSVQLLTAIVGAATAFAADGPRTDDGSVQAEVDQLRAEIATYRQERHEEELSANRADAIVAIITDVLAESETRTSLRQMANDEFSTDWNVIQSADGNFSMEVNYYIQADWIYNHTESQNTEYGFETQRNRLTFSGNVINPSLQYYLRLDFGVDGEISTEAAFVQFDFCENWNFQAGKVYSIFCLEENIANDEELGVNVSFVAGQFDQETEAGLVLAWQGEAARAWVTYYNGFGQTGINPLTNTRQGIMFRFGYKPFGNWDDLYEFNPYPKSTEPGVLLGLAGAYDWGTYNDMDPPPSVVTGPATRASADITWQIPGFSIMNAGYFQDWGEGGDLGGTRWAAVSQVTGFLTPEWQLYGRYEWGRIMDSVQSDVSIATVGMSFYPFQTAVVKYSLEFLYSFGATLNWQADGDPGIRQTTEPQAIIRSQVQLSF